MLLIKLAADTLGPEILNFIIARTDLLPVPALFSNDSSSHDPSSQAVSTMIHFPNAITNHVRFAYLKVSKNLHGTSVVEASIPLIVIKIVVFENGIIFFRLWSPGFSDFRRAFFRFQNFRPWSTVRCNRRESRECIRAR